MATAIVFPGQGSQTPSAGRPWLDHPAWQIVEQAEAATGLPLSHLLLEADADELADTRSSQLSVLLLSLVTWEAVRHAGPDDQPVGFAGHSLGQITALIASGTLTLTDGLELAVARADASAACQAAHPGTMLALLGADEAQATDACAAAPNDAWVANINGAGQVVVGCRPEALTAVTERAEAVGIRRTRRLAVDGAFHTPLMADAATQLSPTLARLRFSAPQAPLVTNHDARAVTTGDGWPARLTAHLTSPVRWADTVTTLVGLGADTFVEVGPGTVLTGLTKRLAPDATTHAVSTPAHLPVGATS